YRILKSQFGQSGPNRADFNFDNIVNAADFNLLKDSFGFTGAPPDNPVPPSSGDASLVLVPDTVTLGLCPAPPNGGTTNVGCTFVIDLYLHGGTQTNLAAE